LRWGQLIQTKNGPESYGSENGQIMGSHSPSPGETRCLFMGKGTINCCSIHWINGRFGADLRPNSRWHFTFEQLLCHEAD
jgi:hypothetical protein